MAGLASGYLATLLVATLVLTGCVEGAGKPSASSSGAAGTPAQSKSTRLVDRDVEAPEVFQVTDQGLWDGRPSLGGVWVASPDAKDPERVIIRNTANGKFVIGALFRRERDNPGPKIQISSDAAEALGLLAGQPGQINVTALRRDEAPTSAPNASQPILDGPETIASETAVAAAEPTAKATTAALDTAAVAAAIDKADGSVAGGAPEAMAAATPDPAPKKKWWQRKAKPAAEPAVEATAAEVETAALAAPASSEISASALPAATAAAAPAAPAPAPAAPSGGKSLIQLGIFSVEANAERAADMVKKAGSPATVRKESGQGKVFWSVVAGPANSAAEREALLKKVKGLGFADAYFVSR